MHNDTAFDLAYPDIVEDEQGRVFIFEAHEGALACNSPPFVALGGCGVAVHLVPPAVLAGLRQQMLAPGKGYTPTVTTENLLLEKVNLTGAASLVPAPPFPNPSDARAGLTVEIWIVGTPADSSTTLFDCRGHGGLGLAVLRAPGGRVQFILSTASHVLAEETDAASVAAGPSPSLGQAHSAKVHHVAVVLDGGPPLVRWVVDGASQDGGAGRVRGWAFYNAALLGPLVGGATQCRVGAGVSTIRVYGRQLTTSQLVDNFRAGPSAGGKVW